MGKPGVVVIGRNEGERLRRCLTSLAESRPCLIYVDSGSTDGSVALAESLGVEVVQLDLTEPFSAARARNEGFAQCLHQHPHLESVMFVDGDCEVVAGWLERAEVELLAHPDVVVVCGRRREIHPEQSVYNRLVDLEWDTPIGPALSCGGDALFRVAAYRAVGGFDPSVRACEEPELCQRLRARGGRVVRIDAEMTRHDLNMTRLGQWWRRQARFGYHSLNIERNFPPPIAPASTIPPSLFGASLRRARLWGIGWPVLTLILSGGIGAVLGWNYGLLAVGLMVSLLTAQMGRLAWRVRRQVQRPGDAVAYGVLMVLDKWANLVGQWEFLRDQRRGRGPRLIEYKGPEARVVTATVK